MRLLSKNASVLIFFLVLSGCERDKITEPVDNTTPPATPSNLIVYAAYDGQIGIEWQRNNEQNLKGYFIYSIYGVSMPIRQAISTPTVTVPALLLSIILRTEINI